METLFSIIVPTYNRGYILWKTIQSVQKQIYPHWELLIIDDGSTDDTEKVVNQFYGDSRIKYFKIKHSGVARARNTGLKKAKSKFVAYLDSDDIYYENFLSIVKEMFEKYPEKIFVIPNYNFRIELYDSKYKLIDFTRMEQRQPEDMTLQDIYHWKVKSAFGTGLVHKRSIKDIKWDESLFYLDDWDFVMQLGNRYPDGFLHIPYVLYEYRQRFGIDGQASLANYKDFGAGFEAIYQKHKKDVLMKGQNWYPRLTQKYKKLQKEFDEGKIPAAVYKYFPKHGKLKRRES